MRGCCSRGKALLLIILAGVLLFTFSASGEWNGADTEYDDGWDEYTEGQNLLYNGDFELPADSDGLPEGWDFSQYYTGNGITAYSVVTDDEAGRGRVAEIWNKGKNDARLKQTVQVVPDTIYCLSGYIWAEDILEGHGANFSIEDIYTFSEEIFDTNGEWVEVRYYGVTGPYQDKINVCIRVGGYGGLSSGKARFDGLCLREVYDEAETGYVVSWFTSDQNDNEFFDDDDPGFEDEEDTSFIYAQVESGENSRLFLILTGAGWMAVMLFIAAFFQGKKRARLLSARTELYYFVPALILAFIARLAISYHVKGYEVDVSCFLSWGGTMDTFGPLKFYEKTSYCDYPPLYTYILSLNATIVRWTGASPEWTRIIFRLFPCLCDLMSCCLMYRYAKEKMPERIHRACVVLILFMLNPAVILNSAAWGQVDSVLCLMLLIVALYAVKGKWQIALPVYAVSVLLKPQALMLGILGLAYIVMTLIRKKESRIPIAIGTIAAVASMAVIILPFGVQQTFGWLIDKYTETLSSYPFASVNTANIYYLLGGNWEKIRLTSNIAAPVILACACAVYSAWWYSKNRKSPYSWIETVLALDFSFLFVILAVMGASWGAVGAVAMAFAFIITVSFAIRNRSIQFLPYLGALLFILLYVFGVKMHERYIFPAIFLLAGAWVIQRDRRILYVLALFSLTLFVNEGIVLDNSIRFGAKYGHLLSNTVAIADILSILNIGGAVYALCIGYEIMVSDDTGKGGYNDPRVFPDNIPRKRMPLHFHPDRSLHWKWKDGVILSVVTVVYAVIALTTLGSTKAPQTGWTSVSPYEQIIFDLGENHKPVSILYFGRVSPDYAPDYYSDFAFSQSPDLRNWSPEVYAEMNQGECWKWKYVVESYGSGKSRQYNQSIGKVLYFTLRYVKLTAKTVDLRLNEIIFRDQDGNVITPKIYDGPGAGYFSDPSALLDEQDTLEALPDLVDGRNGDNKGAQPSWWNSMYFDEIYHARTGYELLHNEEVRGAEPYENSHPPLGKVLMSASIALFGMTPFGWRFAGAMAGILMLPGMYFLAKQLTKKTWIASLAAILMALDCMHLTQTQIATIDSFPVLFIIFAYFFMLRYIQTDVIREPLRKSLVPLGCSGLFMGLSIASKWIGIYAGAGLAVLFFWHAFRMIRISAEAWTLAAGQSVTPEERERLMLFFRPGRKDSQPVFSKLFIICHFCVLFFILIPAGIYLLSYVPYLACRTDIHSFGDYLTAVWNCQNHMLLYHSKPGLGMDHPFYSPWYEWPMMLKPMYYAARQYLTSRTTVPYSIFSFGNPAVWWGAIPALGLCILRWINSHCYQVSLGYELPASRRKLFRPDFRFPFHLTAKTYDNRIAFVLVGLLAEYLPWVLVPRGTYIYHYFASVPFMILCICLCFDGHTEDKETRCRVTGALLALCALAAFIIFFPYASGLAVSRSWLDIGAGILRIYY